jgi:hypothetical protein
MDKHYGIELKEAQMQLETLFDEYTVDFKQIEEVKVVKMQLELSEILQKWLEKVRFWPKTDPRSIHRKSFTDFLRTGHRFKSFFWL